MVSQSDFLRNAGRSGNGTAVCRAALPRSGLVQCTLCRCRHKIHKTANVLNKVALSVQANMKTDLREIYGAPTRAAAEAAIDVFAGPNQQ